jgi:type VI protein secretion system component Hcp
MRRSRKFEEELAVRERPSAPVDEAAEEHNLADEALRLQELVGNRNTTAAIARSALQRDETATAAEPMAGGEKASGYTMTMSEIGTFELLSFQWGAAKPAPPQRGEKDEKPTYQDLVASKHQDEHSAKLSQYAAEGKRIEKIEIVMTTSRGTMTIILKDVYISSIQVGQGQGDANATETFSLNFAEMEYKLPQDSK